MTPLNQWAIRHQIQQTALADLMALLGVQPVSLPTSHPAGNEATVLQQVRLEAARRGMRLWRNNVGACQDESGRMIRYGVGNDSAAVNRVMKSSDLIGITPVTCGCGQRYGVFTAIECKAPGWKFRQSDDRAVAQLTFIKLVISLGGIAKFVTNQEEL